MQIAIAHFARHEVAQTSGRIVGGILVVLWGFAAAFSTSTEGPYSATCRSANGKNKNKSRRVEWGEILGHMQSGK